MPDEIVDIGVSHNEDPISRCEIWIIYIDEHGNAIGKREIEFENPTEYDLPLNKQIYLEFDKPAYKVKYDNNKLLPIDNDYHKYATPTLTDKVDKRSSIKKTIDFEYPNFARAYSKGKRIRQFLSKEIIDLPLHSHLTYQLPHRRFFGRFAYIVEYNKDSNLQFYPKEQKFTFLAGPLTDNDIAFDYRPRPVLHVVIAFTIVILLVFFIMKSVDNNEKAFEYLGASIFAIICGIVANKMS